MSTLKDVPIDKILAVFNLAFSDYIISIQFTETQLKNKIRTEDIVLELSAGAFDDGNLVGFILHGARVKDGRKILYNAGTGVIPSFRGCKLTQKLYKYTLPELKLLGYSTIQLEVITENSRAIKTYTNIGFKINRTFNCYKGKLQVTSSDFSFRISEVDGFKLISTLNFCDWEPAWQNDIYSIENADPRPVTLAVYDKLKLVGYLIFNRDTNRIVQFAVDPRYRRKGISKQLFSFVSKHYDNEVSVINIDDSDKATNAFLANVGLEHFIMQYEMTIEI